jgi:hypothetical protein
MGVLSLILTACSGSTELEPRIANYAARLSPLNVEVPSPLNAAFGSALFSQHVQAQFTAIPLVPGQAYRGIVFSGAACPAPGADTNEDGWIDIVEARAVFGDGLVPLDGDLRSQAGGSDVLPLADDRGIVDFGGEAELDALLADLHGSDPDPGDLLGKLKPEEELDLEDRTFVLLGAPSAVVLPSTVASVPELTRNESLPIACGEIVNQPLFD